MNYFVCPKPNDFDLFFKYYHDENTENTLKKAFECKNGTKQSWVTYRPETHTVFFSVCLAFTTQDNSFTVGMNDW